MRFLPSNSDRTANLDTPSPQRLAEGGGTAYERRLLEAARWDAAPTGAASRVEAALGGVLSDTAGPLSSPLAESFVAAGGKAGQFGWQQGKYWLTGTLGVGLVGAALWSERPLEDPPSKAVVIEIASPEVAAPAIANVANRAAGVSSSPAVATDAPEAQPATSRRGAHSRRDAIRDSKRGTSSALGAPVGPGRLRDEVRALDAVRSSLAAGQGEESERRLAQYHERFPNAELALEAELLSVDVASALGRHREAADQARALLGRDGASRYAQHLNRVIRQSEPTEVDRSASQRTSGGRR